MTDKNVLFIFIIILYLSIMGIIIKILRQRDRKLELQKYEIDIKFGTDNRIENQLDTLINSIFEEYRLYNLEYRDSNYIKEIDEKEIISDICNMVINRISPVFLRQLSTYFNTDSIGEVIATKIYTKVAEYRVQRNIEDKKIKG